ncbi:TRAP transporter small permease [Acuticoccus sp. M5D2P5]|uniref:TRAP transporter small permease n=1 Tax=Acuticoccus kalidii TaxID=2910977 RepID=UPI001F1E53E1|nr:TRAP transporter small permease [Acuticoccus kalidii]MCF3936250.1 TRAP transporter small permease [Acuticoccus kalidii]
MLKRVNDAIEAVLLNIAALLFVLFIAIVFLQVVARNYLQISLLWTDEVALLCFVWTVLLGAAVAVRKRLHYVVEVLPASFVRANRGLQLFAGLACLVLIYVMIVPGYGLAEMGWRRYSISLRMPLYYLFLSFPVAGVAMALFTVEVFLEDVRAFRSGTAPAPHFDEGDL